MPLALRSLRTAELQLPLESKKVVIPAKAGIHFDPQALQVRVAQAAVAPRVRSFTRRENRSCRQKIKMDSRFRGNDVKKRASLVISR